MIRALIFDCFGVLYVDASHDFYERQVPNYTTLRPQLMELNKQSDYGLISQDEWMDAVSEVTGLDRSFVGKTIQAKHVRNQALLDYTQELRHNYRIGMLSNIGIGAMNRFFSPEDRSKLFDGVILSSEVGLTKPHPEVFRLTAEKLGCTPDECVMIDDLEENCSGADAAGMKAIHYTTNQQLVQDLTELLEQNHA